MKSETDWAAIAAAYRRLLDAQVRETDLTEAERDIAKRLATEDLDAIESIHTSEIVKEGARVLRLSGQLFKDAPAPVTHPE